MKTLIYLFIIVLFSSCLTSKRIKNHCEEFAAICVVSSSVEKTIEYRDTTVYIDKIVEIQLPNDTVTVKDTIRVKDGVASLPIVHREQGNIAMDIGVVNSIINANAYYKDSTIFKTVHDTIFLDKVIKEIVVKVEKAIVLPPEKYTSKWHKFTSKFFILFLIVGIVFGGWWLAKNTNVFSIALKFFKR